MSLGEELGACKRGACDRVVERFRLGFGGWRCCEGGLRFGRAAGVREELDLLADGAA